MKRLVNGIDVEAVYDVLVQEVGAPNRPFDREHFLRAWPASPEYRFGGTLGFGGKVWFNAGRIYVTAYPEDITELRQAAIDAANERLAKLTPEGQVVAVSVPEAKTVTLPESDAFPDGTVIEVHPWPDGNYPKDDSRTTEAFKREYQAEFVPERPNVPNEPVAAAPPTPPAKADDISASPASIEVEQSPDDQP